MGRIRLRPHVALGFFCLSCLKVQLISPMAWILGSSGRPHRRSHAAIWVVVSDVVWVNLYLG